MEIRLEHEISKEIKSIYGDEYSLIEYYDDSNKIKIKHNICGNTWTIKCHKFSPSHICLCPTCKTNKRNKCFLEKINSLVANEYKPLSDYYTSATYIKFRHEKCNLILYIKPKDFFEGKRCETCLKNFSKDDKLIKKRCAVCNSEFMVSEKEISSSDMEITWCSKKCKEKMKENTCKTCGKKIVSKSYQAYCSKECKKDICKVCGKTFYRKNNESYCSEKCRDVLYSHTCKCCGEKFISHNSRKFCSPECRIAYSSLKSEICICKNCKILIKYKGTKVDFCSSQCKMEYFAKAKECKKDKIDVKKLRDIISFRVSTLVNIRKKAVMNVRNTIDYRLINGFTDLIKENVKMRDDRKCFICGCDVNLNIHHIIPQRFGGSHKENNLITLCKKCHRYIETGNEAYAIFKCLKNAKEYFGLIEFNSKSFEKVPMKTQLESIEKDLSDFWNKFVEIDVDDSLELKEKLADVIDDVSNCIKDYK